MEALLHLWMFDLSTTPRPQRVMRATRHRPLLRIIASCRVRDTYGPLLYAEAVEKMSSRNPGVDLWEQLSDESDFHSRKLWKEITTGNSRSRFMDSRWLTRAEAVRSTQQVIGSTFLLAARAQCVRCPPYFFFSLPVRKRGARDSVKAGGATPTLQHFHGIMRSCEC